MTKSTTPTAILAKYDLVCLELLNQNGKLNPRKINLTWLDSHTDLKDEIWKKTYFLKDDVSLLERIYAYLLKITTIPTCSICKTNLVKFCKQQKNYRLYCSRTCQGKSESVKIKRLLTNFERYNESKNFSSASHTEKVKRTSLEKYGTSHAMKNSLIKNKLKKSHISKYGDWYTKTDAYKEKSKISNIKKYGVDHVSKTDQWKQSHSKNGNKRYKGYHEIKDSLICDYIDNKMPKSNLAIKYNYSLSHMNKILKYFNLPTDLPQNKIYKHNFVSKAENEILTFIKDSGYAGIIDHCNRNILGVEIDIWLPDLQLGIEYNGDWWHSDFFKDRNYHKDKLELAEKNGIKLINIFEFQWNHKPLIIKNKIINKLRMSKNKTDARKCTIKELSQATADIFYNEYHIYGTKKSFRHIGLIFDDKIVSCASFSKFRSGGMELSRYCTSLNVRGGFSKILSYVNYDEIWSYADRNWTYIHNNMYISNNFTQHKITYPNYRYVNQNGYINRTSAMKHKLEHLLGGKFDSSLSESQNLYKAGYKRIWDCGNILYKLER